jgi:phage terminase Nu1 subunit (DNA packaging protein)
LKKPANKARRRPTPAPSKPKPRLVGIAHVAERLRLTPRRIQQLVGEGLPRVTRAKYDVDAVLDWYIAKLEKQLAGESDEDADNVSQRKHELRLLAAKADLEELDLATKRRDLVAIADVEKAHTDLVITTKARILAVPARVAADLVGEQSRVMAQAKVEKALKEALSHLAS